MSLERAWTCRFFSGDRPPTAADVPHHIPQSTPTARFLSVPGVTRAGPHCAALHHDRYSATVAQRAPPPLHTTPTRRAEPGPPPAVAVAQHDDLLLHVAVRPDGQAAVGHTGRHLRRLPGERQAADPHGQWVAPGHPRGVAAAEGLPGALLAGRLWHCAPHCQVPRCWRHKGYVTLRLSPLRASLVILEAAPGACAVLC